MGIVDGFLMQFKRESGKLVYRKNARGAAYPVTTEERDRLARQFKKRLVIFFIAQFAVGMLLLFFGLPWLESRSESETTLWIWIGLAVVFIPILPFMIWAMGAPERELANRMELGPQLSWDEHQKRHLTEMSWGQMGSLAIAAVILCATISFKTDVTSGWGRLWIFVFALLGVVIAFQAWRKHKLGD